MMESVMSSRLFICLCVIFSVVLDVIHAADASMPIAMHQLVVVSQASNAVIRLKGYDGTVFPGLTYSVETAPETGKLYQLSQVYSDYNIEPKAGTRINGFVNVTGSNNRVYYTRPSPDVNPTKLWDTFSFSVTNKVTQTKSFHGTISLVASNGYLVSSDFLLSNEMWTIIGNKASSSSAKHEPYSRGLQLNHYVLGTDDVVHVLYQNGNNNGRTKVAANTKTDSSLWYFHAPEKYYDNFGISYTGTLSFTMASFSGDFTKLNDGLTPVVEMECAQCVGPVTRGIRLVFNMETLLAKQKLNPDSTGTTTFSLPLTETGGWLIDPQNTLVTNWRQPTKCEFIQVLSAISSFNILGDWTQGIESVGIDNVVLAANTKPASSENQNGNVIPLCALKRPDASVCTC